MKRLLVRGLIACAALSAAASVFFHAKVRDGDARVDAFVRSALVGVPRADTEAVALAIARAVFLRTNRTMRAADLPLYERLESASFFNITSAVSLEHGAYGVAGRSREGPCGTMTRVTLNALARLGIPARKLHMLDDPPTPGGWHTMLEFRSGGRWLVVSPSDSAFVWRTHDGRIATFEEIRADSTIFGEIVARFPRYPYRPNLATPRIRWEKLPRPVRAVFRLVLGRAGYEGAVTPSLYDEPRRVFFIASVASLFGFGFAALLVGGASHTRLGGGSHGRQEP